MKPKNGRFRRWPPPIALGAGLPLFADEFNLKLVDSRPFPISIWLRQCETPLLRRAVPHGRHPADARVAHL